MEKEEIIKKWLEGTLSAEEKNLFESSADFAEIKKLLDHASSFKAPIYDVESELKSLRAGKAKTHNVVTITSTYQFLKIAASIIIIVGLVYYFFPSKPKTMVQISSINNSEVHLPDSSFVRLNAESYVHFSEGNWSADRRVILIGEAYFEVAEGSLFEVETSTGVVKVLGTKFNVRDRDGILEVSCYEGHVNVEYDYQGAHLYSGQKIWISSDSTSGKTTISETGPSWINGVSTFESTSVINVISELERQYEVDVMVNQIDTTVLFSGTFTHDNIDLALKSITLPLNLTYQVNGQQIVLSKMYE